MRIISLILASAASIIGLAFPFILARQATGINQTILLIMMLGIAAAFIYGAGFKPTQKWLKIVIAPILTWPVMLGSFGVLLLIR